MRFVRMACLLALALVALPAAAGNLVGSWLGSFACPVEDSGGRSTLRQRSSDLLISQPGGPGTSPLRLTIDGVQYAGSIVPLASDPTERGAGSWRRTSTADPGIAACP